MNTALNITSQRDLEKEFTHLIRLFEGKETELNWTARNNAIIRLRKIINEQNEEWRDTLLSGIRELATGIVKTIHSMRTTFATEALLLISDISLTLGDGLDNYTSDLFLNNLLKLSGVTKRIIVDKSIEVTNIFLESIAFHIKTLNILCKSMQERNMQTKQACTTFFKTILKKHAENESTRLAMEKAGAVNVIIEFLKRGLADASPKVRENSRQLYWLFHQYWPDKAETMTQSMDSKTLSPLKRVTTIKSSPSRFKSPTTSLRPPLKRSLSSASSSPSPLKRSAIPTKITVEPSTSKLNRLSHISNVSAPASTTVNKQISASTPTRRTKSDYHEQGAAISILHMLQSKDTSENIKALYTLCDKMKHVQYPDCILPSDIPPKVSLSLAIMDFLSNHELDSAIYHTLMSWQCLINVFVNILAFHYYAPTLIIANEEQKSEMLKIFGKGLMRLKLFLKRKDRHLAKSLFDLLKACKNRDDSVLDSSVKRDMWVYPSYRESLMIGLMKWLDEIVCESIGLAEEEDQDLLMEGSRYLNGDPIAGEWFDIDDNIEMALQLVFGLLVDYEEKKQREESDYYSSICMLLGHLKMANERVFDYAILAVDNSSVVNKALGIHQLEEVDPIVELPDVLDFSFGSIELEDMKPESPISEAAVVETWDNILDQDYCDDDHTGMTQEISDLNFGIEVKKMGELLNNPKMEYKESKHIRRSPSPIITDAKKRKLLGCDDLDTQQASKLIFELETSPKRALFLQLETIPKRVWFENKKILLESLIEILIDVLSDNPDSTIRLQATRFLKSLIQDKVLALASSKLTFRLLKSLFDGWTDEYSHMPLAAEETVHLFLMNDQTALKQLWNLANNYLCQNSNHALSSLFNFIGKEAVKISIDRLEESLSESEDILVKCFSHDNIAVRKSCVQACVGIHQALGDPFVKVYLAALKSDQLYLLNLYISRAK